MPPKVEKAKSAQKSSGKKGSPSAYLLFCKDKRLELKSQHPDIVGKEVMKMLGSSWKALSDDEKDVYKKKLETTMKSLG